jgi:putative glutamine amidotransferase
MEDGRHRRLAQARTRRAGHPSSTNAGRYNRSMRPLVAIPVPHFADPEYAERALPQYLRAVEMAGGQPVRIPLDKTPAEVLTLIEHCDAALLPGSKADVDPAKYKTRTDPKTAPADPKRDLVDELLLRDAYAARKPILGICYGLQIMNVFRGGTLLQHIESTVNHDAGRDVPIAHSVELDATSKLGEIVIPAAKEERVSIPVNSSHHQSAEKIGDGLRMVGRCEQDGIIEALEGTSPDHFVVAVQWHPERSVEDDAGSRAIFRALVEAARR